eukprot:CAMPEP_0182509326 /NCGR_PEP_ID=MMETSP1321-20130603/26649_1 /TAXON_ID=91990 /ORGANISM="Bolidomonas sp., Strain RCC1657" /LENGTH=70 /DNA_ID=CAMNT_0024715577 /DNA_START=159 /DNA_END=371 /DNA_ORIENTATION=+
MPPPQQPHRQHQLHIPQKLHVLRRVPDQTFNDPPARVAYFRGPAGYRGDELEVTGTEDAGHFQDSFRTEE